MTGIINNNEKRITEVDTNNDKIFTQDTTSPWYEYFYNHNGNSFYAAKKNRSDEYVIVKMSNSEIARAIHGAEILDEKILSPFI